MTKNTNTSDKSILDNINLDELIKTTNLEILPNYTKDVILDNDLKTIRQVIIESLPEAKDIESEKFTGQRLFMKIKDNGILYNLSADSVSLRRSLIALDIQENNVQSKDEIDLSRLIGKMYNIKRVKFTSKNGLTNTALNFFLIK